MAAPTPRVPRSGGCASIPSSSYTCSGSESRASPWRTAQNAGRFGKHIGDLPWHVHVIPFTYYVLYVFLIRQAFLDLFTAREDAARRATVEKAYVAVSLGICVVFWLLDR